jgi:hypothetical protein
MDYGRAVITPEWIGLIGPIQIPGGSGVPVKVMLGLDVIVDDLIDEISRSTFSCRVNRRIDPHTMTQCTNPLGEK